MKSIVVPLGFSIILVVILVEYGNYVSRSAPVQLSVNPAAALSGVDSGTLPTGQPVFNAVFTNASDVATILR